MKKNKEILEKIDAEILDDVLHIAVAVNEIKTINNGYGVIDCKWKLESGGVWENYYRCNTCKIRVHINTDGGIDLPERCFKDIYDLKVLLCDYYDCIETLDNPLQLQYKNKFYKIAAFKEIGSDGIRYKLVIFEGRNTISLAGVFDRLWTFTWTSLDDFTLYRKDYDKALDLSVMDQNYQSDDISLFELLGWIGAELKIKLPEYWR